MTIIECTTGNAGIACSAVAAIKGYRCAIVMPEGMSNERKTMIKAYGADLVLTPGAGTDIDLALERMREIVAADPDRYFFPGGVREPRQPRGAARERRGDLGAVGRPGRRGRRGRRAPAGGSAVSPTRSRAATRQSRVRGRAGRVPVDHRAHMGHAWGAGHRRRHRASTSTSPRWTASSPSRPKKPS